MLAIRSFILLLTNSSSQGNTSRRWCQVREMMSFSEYFQRWFHVAKSEAHLTKFRKIQVRFCLQSTELQMKEIAGIQAGACQNAYRKSSIAICSLVGTFHETILDASSTDEPGPSPSWTLWILHFELYWHCMANVGVLGEIVDYLQWPTIRGDHSLASKGIVIRCCTVWQLVGCCISIE